MRDVDDAIRRAEDRLERLVAAGWRNAREDADELGREGEALAEAGLRELAARLQAVAAARTPAEAMAAVSLALSACRLVRLRLESDVVAGDGWRPVEPKATRRSAVDHIMPIGRMLVEGEEVWAGVRLWRGDAAEWLLLDPLPHVGAFPLAPATAQSSPDASSPAPPFLDGPWFSQVRGRLAWRGRYPLGASGEVQRYVLEAPEPFDPSPEEPDPVAEFFGALAEGTMIHDRPVGKAHWALRLIDLLGHDRSQRLVVDPSGDTLVERGVEVGAWAIAWVMPAGIVPLVLITPANRHRPPLVTHLIPGADAVPLVSNPIARPRGPLLAWPNALMRRWRWGRDNSQAE